MNFIPATQPSADSQSLVYWFLFYEEQLLMETGTSDPRLVLLDKNLPVNFKVTSLQYLGSLDDKPCYTALLSGTANIPKNMSFIRVRDLYDKFPEDLFWLIGRAFHITVWDRRTLYCGSCGAPTENMTRVRAKVCPKCRQLIFPRISPAIIVAIFREGKILLARNRNLPADLFTVIAGFVEPGETLEECLQREVREEVGIAVKNIRYFSSQPWPFPDSLMVAFTAEYAGGDIQVDGEEIIEADWFSADNLPKVPGKVSVARKLIDWYQDQYRTCGGKE
ncbi:MAG TPA: NAD(+) diphosphatase [Firmicutes bacterium]|jgi:NAD+ diphosphatase|nr:NAD(+) diphosphatase [Bacillota bacterium]